MSENLAPAAGKFVWSESWSVGVPEVDDDHRALFDLIEMISSTSKGDEARAVTGTVLGALMDYTEFHFEREERMQQAIGYQGFAGHKAKHDKLKAQVQDYQTRFNQDPASVDVSDLSLFLQKWLVEHILKEDMLYKPFAQNNPKASEAMASVGLSFFMEQN